MHALIMNGFAETTQASTSIIQVITDELEACGWTSEVVSLGEMDIAYCRGCFDCWIKTPGECIIDDVARDVTRKMIQSDLVVYLSPITFGGYSPTLKKALDRSICLLHPYFAKVHGEYHHRKRYDSYPSVAGFGVLLEADDEVEGLFKRLIHRNSINLHSQSHAAGILYEEQESEEMKKTVGEILLEVGVTA